MMRSATMTNGQGSVRQHGVSTEPFPAFCTRETEAQILPTIRPASGSPRRNRNCTPREGIYGAVEPGPAATMGVTARLAACSAATLLALTLHATGVSAAPACTKLAFAAGQMPLSPFASRHSGASCLQMATKTKTKSKARTSAKTSNGGFGKKTESPVSSGVDVAALLRASTVPAAPPPGRAARKAASSWQASERQRG